MIRWIVGLLLIFVAGSFAINMFISSRLASSTASAVTGPEPIYDPTSKESVDAFIRSPLGKKGREIMYDVPPYPLWVAQLLAPLEIPPLQAKLGFVQAAGVFAEPDLCGAIPKLRSAALKSDLFAVYWLFSAYAVQHTPENRYLAAFWLLRWQQLSGMHQSYFDINAKAIGLDEALVNEARDHLDDWLNNRRPAPESATCLE